MLGPDAPFAELANIWQDTLDGFPTTLNVKVRLQAVIGTSSGTDLTWFDIHDSSVIGFSDGTATAAYLVIQPGFITFDNAKDNEVHTLYGQVDLPVQVSPAFQLLGEAELRVYQTSGGDRGFAPNRDPAGAPVVSFTDLSVTAVAPSQSISKAAGGVVTSANLAAFGQLRDWIDAILQGSGSSTAIGRLQESDDWGRRAGDGPGPPIASRLASTSSTPFSLRRMAEWRRNIRLRLRPTSVQ